MNTSIKHLVKALFGHLIHRLPDNVQDLVLTVLLFLGAAFFGLLACAMFVEAIQASRQGREADFMPPLMLLLPLLLSLLLGALMLGRYFSAKGSPAQGGGTIPDGGTAEQDLSGGRRPGPGTPPTDKDGPRIP
jgi:hypothetical protein